MGALTGERTEEWVKPTPTGPDRALLFVSSRNTVECSYELLSSLLAQAGYTKKES